ncbi:MAG: hypothetical protein RBT59_06410 [Arcobacteraceae bacterium]|nr:hypothetical protein [Arcobacteraceae bacterium]
MKIVHFIIVSFLIIGFSGCSTNHSTFKMPDHNINKSLEENNVSVVVPVYSQVVSIKLPNISWKAVYEKNIQKSYRIEFIPKDEDNGDWENLISIQGFKNMVSDARKYNLSNSQILKGYTARILLGYSSICPKEKFISEVIQETDNRVDMIMGCSVPPKISTNSKYVKEAKGELGYYIFMNGKQDLYLIHKAVRGSEEEIKNKLNKNTAKDFIAPIEPIQLINRD